VIAFEASFGFVTAFALSCAAPTLFLGICETAATLVPPRATSKARAATTVAGDGAFRKGRRIAVLLSLDELSPEGTRPQRNVRTPE
jgi:hypothetical protein